MAIPTRQALRAFCKDQYLEKNVIHVHAVMDHFGVSEQVATDLLAALEQEGFFGGGSLSGGAEAYFMLAPHMVREIENEVRSGKRKDPTRERAEAEPKHG